MDQTTKLELSMTTQARTKYLLLKFVLSIASTFTSKTIRYILKIKYQKPVKIVVSTSAFYASTTKHIYAPNSRIICYACHKVGHKVNQCNMLKRNSHVRQIWIPKKTNLANQKGPKVAWVPKNNP